MAASVMFQTIFLKPFFLPLFKKERKRRREGMAGRAKEECRKFGEKHPCDTSPVYTRSHETFCFVLFSLLLTEELGQARERINLWTKGSLSMKLKSFSTLNVACHLCVNPDLMLPFFLVKIEHEIEADRDSLEPGSDQGRRKIVKTLARRPSSGCLGFQVSKSRFVYTFCVV